MVGVTAGLLSLAVREVSVRMDGVVVDLTVLVPGVLHPVHPVVPAAGMYSVFQTLVTNQDNYPRICANSELPRLSRYN